MFYITNKTQELFLYNRTNHSRVDQVYIGLTNNRTNFADKLNNCTLQQNPRLQEALNNIESEICLNSRWAFYDFCPP